MSVLSEIATLLTAVSGLNIGSLPTTPDIAVGIYNSGGYPRSMSGNLVEEPTFQVRVRHTVYTTGEALCETISGLLHGKSTTHLMMIQQQGGIMDLGRDEKNRPEWSMNFRCYYRK